MSLIMLNLSVLETLKIIIMMKPEIKNGIFIFLLIGIYFLIIDFLGLGNVSLLKLANIIFIVIGVNLTIKHYANTRFAYLSIFAKGFATALIGIMLSLIGLFVYFQFILGGADLSEYQTTLIPATKLSHFFFAMFFEGMAVAAIIPFTLLQYWRKYIKETSA